MKNFKQKFYLVVSSFLGFSILICFKLKFSNYLPIVFAMLFVPYLLFRMMNISLSSSSYIMKNHPDFYNTHKTITSSLDGKVVNLFWASDKEIEMLSDIKVLDFRSELKNIRELVVTCFIGFFLLGMLTVFFA